MKSLIVRAAEKPYEFQGIRVSEETTPTNSKGEALMQEFSEMLDKIAARVNERIREANTDFGALFDIVTVPYIPERVREIPPQPKKSDMSGDSEELKNNELQEELQEDTHVLQNEGPKLEQGKSEAKVEKIKPESSEGNSEEKYSAEQSAVESPDEEQNSRTLKTDGKKMEPEALQNTAPVEFQEISEAEQIPQIQNEQNNAVAGTEIRQEELSLSHASSEEEPFVPEAALQNSVIEGNEAPADISRMVVKTIEAKPNKLQSTGLSPENIPAQPQEINEKIVAQVAIPQNFETNVEKKAVVSSESVGKISSNILTAALFSSLLPPTSPALSAGPAPSIDSSSASIGKLSAQALASKVVNAAASNQGSQAFFAQQGESFKANIRQRADTASNPQPQQQALLKNLERVESVLREAAKSRDGKTISLRLDPPELGSVKIDVSLRDGQLHARLSADAPNVSQMLRERAHELQASLRKLGILVDKVSVSVQGGGEITSDVPSDSGSFLSQWGEAHERREQFPESRSAGFESGSAATKLAAIPASEIMLDHWIA